MPLDWDRCESLRMTKYMCVPVCVRACTYMSVRVRVSVCVAHVRACVRMWGMRGCVLGGLSAGNTAKNNKAIP